MTHIRVFVCIATIWIDPTSQSKPDLEVVIAASGSLTNRPSSYPSTVRVLVESSTKDPKPSTRSSMMLRMFTLEDPTIGDTSAIGIYDLPPLLPWSSQ